MTRKVYLRGECYGLYGSGDIVLARRNDGMVCKGRFYTIEEVVDLEEANCRRSGIVLEGIRGTFGRKTFKVTNECRNEN